MDKKNTRQAKKPCAEVSFWSAGCALAQQERRNFGRPAVKTAEDLAKSKLSSKWHEILEPLSFLGFQIGFSLERTILLDFTHPRWNSSLDTTPWLQNTQYNPISLIQMFVIQAAFWPMMAYNIVHMHYIQWSFPDRYMCRATCTYMGNGASELWTFSNPKMPRKEDLAYNPTQVIWAPVILITWLSEQANPAEIQEIYSKKGTPCENHTDCSCEQSCRAPNCLHAL